MSDAIRELRAATAELVALPADATGRDEKAADRRMSKAQTVIGKALKEATSRARHGVQPNADDVQPAWDALKEAAAAIAKPRRARK